MRGNLLKIPYGTRDVLPQEAQAFLKMKSKVEEVFEVWGYQPVLTPTLEYASTFGGEEYLQGGFKLLAQNNLTMTLRTEMTAPIARLVATRMPNMGLQRLCYCAQVFRYAQGAQAEKRSEFTQAGVELIGASSPMEDGEVVALALTTLLKTGLTGVKVSLGQIDFIEGLGEAAGLGHEQLAIIKSCLIKHDNVELEKLVEQWGIPSPLNRIFNKLLFLHGGKELLAQLRQECCQGKCLKALDNLEAIYQVLESYKLEQYVSFDLGLMRSVNYYTGMIFEIYADTLGYSICGGGRYDNMMASFGRPAPATGFAFGLERVALALLKEGRADTMDELVVVVYDRGQEEAAISKANRLRTEGYKAVVSEKAATTQLQIKNVRFVGIE